MVDADGRKVAIPLPFRGVVPHDAVIDFLAVTHAPESLAKLGGPKDRQGFADTLMGRIYPQLAKKDSLWDEPDDIESVLAHDNGEVYIGGDNRVGLAAISVVSDWSDMEKVISDEGRFENEAIGHPEHARDAIIAYHQHVVNSENDLHALHYRDRPSMISLVTNPNDWIHLWASASENQDLGTKDATEAMMTLGRGSEAERILASKRPVLAVCTGWSADVMMCGWLTLM